MNINIHNLYKTNSITWNNDRDSMNLTNSLFQILKFVISNSESRCKKFL